MWDLYESRIGISSSKFGEMFAIIKDYFRDNHGDDNFDRDSNPAIHVHLPKHRAYLLVHPAYPTFLYLIIHYKLSMMYYAIR